MKTLKELRDIIEKGLEILKKEAGVIDGVIYASANQRVVGRIVYTSHIPCLGLEEPKSDEDMGLSVEIWFERDGKKLIGFGHEANELTVSAVRRAIDKAKRDAVEDPDFHGFLQPEDLPKKKSVQHTSPHFDSGIGGMTIQEEADTLAKISWETIRGAVDTVEPYLKKHNLSLEEIAFIVNGDNFIIREKMAMASIKGVIDSEESTLILSFLTAMLERENAKGSAWGASISLDENFSAYNIGKEAALAALNGVGGKRIKTGEYKVVFGHQAVTELVGNLFAPHINLGMVEFGASMFTGKYGQQVASENLTLYDDATIPGGPGSKRVSDEGYATGKTLLIDKGKLVGFLSDSRTTNKLLHKREHGKDVLGVDPHEIREAISPRNGFRFGDGGGRMAVSSVGIHATNLIVDSSTPLSEKEILERVGNGIFIGRLWYTYPVGGYASGIISGTAIADCYVIRDGKLAEPILPNTLRIEDNLKKMFNNIIGIGNNARSTILWSSDEITHAPWMAIDDVHFSAINQQEAK